MKKNDWKKWMVCLPVAALFAVLTVLAWILPLRPTESSREKRTLEAFPAFSLSALGDGSYFEGIGLWFSDTFPLRDGWIDADKRLEGLYGWSDIAIYGDARTVELGPEETPAPAEEEEEPAARPAAEAAPAAEKPEEREEELAEETPAPAEEEEDAGSGKTVGEDELLSIGAVIQLGDSVYSFGGFTPAGCDRYADNLNRAAELLRDRCRVFNVFLVSDSTAMLPRDFREKIRCACEEDAVAYLSERLSGEVYDVDVLSALLRHNGEYIYYRTDHHWTALGAWYAYEQWAECAGFEPVPLSEYTENIYEPFYGSLYYKANQHSALRPDQVYAYTPPGRIRLFLNLSGFDSPEYRGEEYALLTDVRGTDKYMCFLLGDHPLCTFINEDITDGSACLLIKNSNGNPFSYYLPQHYQYVYVMDYRKYTSRSLTEFVDEYDVDDVIFCFSSGQAQSSGGNDLLNRLIR